jgi:putative endonuclease
MFPNLGSWGEMQAADFLETNGFKILEKNFRVFEGEVDVVAEKDGSIHFVEVKTRSSTRFGSPEDSLVRKKQMRLLRAGYEYLERNLIEDIDFQFDLIAIECSPNRELRRLTYYENVIGMGNLDDAG